MTKKAITKSAKGDIHLGIETVAGFKPATVDDAKDVLKELGKKKLWRCTVCNDLHISIKPPKECPTCHTKDAYVEIDEKEFKNVLKTLNG